MRKEVIIAIVVGLILAFVITVAVNRASQVLKRQPVQTTINEQKLGASTSPEVTTQASRILAVHNPKDGLIQPEKSTIVTGSTDPNLPVVLLVNTKEHVSLSDAAGNFSFSVPLTDGANVLTLYVLQNDGTSLTDRRTVIVGEY